MPGGDSQAGHFRGQRGGDPPGLPKMVASADRAHESAEGLAKRTWPAVPQQIVVLAARMGGADAMQVIAVLTHAT